MKEEYLLIIVLGLALLSLSNAQFQSCPLITIDDFGSTTEFSSNGLVSQAIAPLGEAAANVLVRIRNFTVVCDAAGDRISTSSYVSVVVEFQCDFQSSTPSLSVCSDPNNIVTRQYQFQCTEQNGQPVWGTIVSGSSLFIQTLDPIATLSTPLANQCRRCIDDQQSTRADPTTHCDCELIIEQYLVWYRSFHVVMFIQSQPAVQLNVTGDRGAAILGRMGMCAVTSTCKEIVKLIARVLWWLIPTSTVVSMKHMHFFLAACEYFTLSLSLSYTLL